MYQTRSQSAVACYFVGARRFNSSNQLTTTLRTVWEPTLVVFCCQRVSQPFAATAGRSGRTRGSTGVSCGHKERDVTDQERQKAEDLVSRLEIAVGQIFPRDGGNAGLIATMIQTLNGLRSLLGIVRPH